MSKNEELNENAHSSKWNSPDENIQWRFDHVKHPFGGKSAITSVEFNHDGDLLAVGSKDGLINVYKRSFSSKSGVSYPFYTRVVSYEQEFDCLKSMKIEPTVVKIRWLKHNPFHPYFLTTNDKTIKLWKLNECNQTIYNFNLNHKNEKGMSDEYNNITSLRMPSIKIAPTTVTASPSRIYKNLHEYNINSISLNSDQATFLSADELRINLWNLDVTNCSFNIVNLAPSDMVDLTEVITSAEFHPIECNTFAHATSDGTISLCDMRSSALCDRYSKKIVDMSNSGSYDENSWNYINFSPSGHLLMARDYMNLKIYDLRMENQLLESYSIPDYVRGRRSARYRTDKVLDWFEPCWSGNDDFIITGTYNNSFCICDRRTRTKEMLEARRLPGKGILKPWRVSTKLKLKPDEIHADFIDYKNKIQYTAWHPKEKTIAVATKKQLFMYKEHI